MVGGVGVVVYYGDDFVLVFCFCICFWCDVEFFVGVGSGVFVGNVLLVLVRMDD